MWLIWLAAVVAVVVVGGLVDKRQRRAAERAERAACEARHPSGRAHATPVHLEIPTPRDGIDR